MSEHFWQIKTLTEMTTGEWESLCDGCAKCCLVKLEDADTGDVYFTRISCSLLDEENCKCTDYPNRLQRVPDCLQLTPQNVDDIHWLPSTCAYRLINEGKSLPDWHPLVSSDSELIHKTGNSVQGRVISEKFVHPDEIEEHIIQWID